MKIGDASRPTLLLLLLANLLLLAFGLVCYRRVAELEARVFALEMPMTGCVRIDNRLFFPREGEDEVAFAERIAAELLVPGDGGFLCEELTGCSVPGGSIYICASSAPKLADLVAAFCARFECTDCGD